MGNFCSSRLYHLFHTVASSAANSCPLAFTLINNNLTKSLCERKIVSFYETVRQKTKRYQQNELPQDTKNSITKVPKREFWRGKKRHLEQRFLFLTPVRGAKYWRLFDLGVLLCYQCKLSFF